MDLNRSAEVLPRVPKGKKAVMCLAERMHASNKLYLAMSHSVIDHEFKVNQPYL